MTDERLRELERRFKKTGALEDEVAWLKERVRSNANPTSLRPTVQIDRKKRLERFKITYVSPCDSKRCPATRSLVLLHKKLSPFEPGDLTSIATEGDRTLFFEVSLPQFDLGDLKAELGVYCASGSVYYRATRRLALHGATGVVFVPTLVEGYKEEAYESAEGLIEDLEHWGLEPEQVPLVLQWLPGDARPEVSFQSVAAEEFRLPFLASYTTDRNTGQGIENALFEVLRRAREAYLEVHGVPND